MPPLRAAVSFSASLILQRRLVLPLSYNFFLKMSVRNKSNALQHDQCEYIISSDSGRYVRHVKPYFQEFRTFSKGRWIGREVLEVFCREFGAHPPSYWINALRNGQVRINNSIVSANYKFKNSDALLHRAHRLSVTIHG